MLNKSVLLSPAALLIYGAVVYAVVFDRGMWYLPLVFLAFTVIWLAILRFFRLDP